MERYGKLEYTVEAIKARLANAGEVCDGVTAARVEWLLETLAGGHLEAIEDQDHRSNDDDAHDGWVWFDRVFFAIPLATFSDYSGCSVERANARLLNDDSDIKEWMSMRRGSHGTEWHGFTESDIFQMDDETITQLDDIFGSLADYPCLDDEAI